MEEEERLDRFDNVQDGDRIGVRGVAGNSDSNASSDTPTFPPKRSVRIAEGAVRSDNRLALSILPSYQNFVLLIFYSIALKCFTPIMDECDIVTTTDQDCTESN